MLGMLRFERSSAPDGPSTMRTSAPRAFRPHRRPAGLAASVASAVAAILAAPSAATPPDAAAPADERSPLERRREAAFEQLRRECLPEPLSAEQIREWAGRLAFDEEGRSLLDAIVANYRNATERTDREAGDAVRQRIDAAFRFDDDARRIEAIHTPEHLQLLAERDRLFERLERADAALFREFEALAAEDRRGELAAIRFERARRLYEREDRLPGASLDLAALLVPLEIDPLAHAGVAETLDRYRREQAAALQDRHQRGRELERERGELLLALGPAWRLVLAEPDRLEAESQLQSLAIAEAELDRPLRSLHRETLLLLRRQLPAEDGRRLQEAYQQATYPELFRDDRRVAEILGEGELAAAVGEAIRPSAEAAIDDALRDVQRSAFLLMELADALSSVTTLPDPTSRAEAAMLLEIRTLELQQARRERLGAALRAVRAMLPPGEAGGDRVLATALASHESLRRAWEYRLAVLDDRVRELRDLPRGDDDSP